MYSRGHHRRLLLCNTPYFIMSPVYQFYLYNFLKKFHKIYKKKYENFSRTIYVDCCTIKKTFNINKGRNIWRRSPSVSKLMKILPILYFFAVCQNNFLGVLWRISHFIKPSKTWNMVYFINQTHIQIKSLIRQIMIPHQCTDSIMRNWLYSGVLRTISWYQISLLFKLH